MAKSLTGFLFSTAVREAVVSKLVIIGISFLTSFILALRVVSVAKLVISHFLFLIFLILALYTSFLTTSFFTIWHSLFKSIGTGTYLLTSNFANLLFKLLKLAGK